MKREVVKTVIKNNDIFVDACGNDKNNGTIDAPFATLERAKEEVKIIKSHSNVPICVYLRGGTYYLNKTFTLEHEDSGTSEAPIIYKSYQNEEVVISGGTRMFLDWSSYRDGIYKAVVPEGTKTDQLFVDGERYMMARYPNYNENVRIFNGYDGECFSKERVSNWKNPKGGFIHSLTKYIWGSYHYLITGKDNNNVIQYEGGWQHNQPTTMHDEYRYVENIFEELDAPGEWYLDESTNTIYVYPKKGIELKNSKIEIVRLKNLINIKGNEERPVTYVHIKGITFTHTKRTFMETREPLLRSDWMIYRGGAIYIEGAEDCQINGCFIDQIGGNGIFASGYNRRINISSCHIANSGATAIAFVGKPDSVRSPLFTYHERQSFKEIDKGVGPKSNSYASECKVDDCLIYLAGRFEKQCAGIEISMAQEIHISHCSIYDVPRAGINISEGTFGGHVIEYCDVFDTVMETGDHGSFNSWGRDRHWGLKDIDIDIDSVRDLSVLDAVKTSIIRNSRWSCEHGWDIDLDDGSTNYHIYNNLCLHGGIKLREGFYRICENNIMVNNSVHPHSWYKRSQDIVMKNIMFSKYRPSNMLNEWGQNFNFNILHSPQKQSLEKATELMKMSNMDENSMQFDVNFVDPIHGDYRVADDSHALEMGFINFPMDLFGVKNHKLREITRYPELPKIKNMLADEGLCVQRDNRVHAWMGSSVKNIVGMGEMSVAGTPGEIGVRIMEVEAGSILERAGFKKHDVILECSGKKVDNFEQLFAYSKGWVNGQIVKMICLRLHEEIVIEFAF